MEYKWLEIIKRLSDLKTLCGPGRGSAWSLGFLWLTRACGLQGLSREHCGEAKLACRAPCRLRDSAPILPASLLCPPPSSRPSVAPSCPATCPLAALQGPLPLASLLPPLLLQAKRTTLTDTGMTDYRVPPHGPGTCPLRECGRLAPSPLLQTGRRRQGQGSRL